jgi:sphinganine-1-phosphate aldolase
MLGYILGRLDESFSEHEITPAQVMVVTAVTVGVVMHYAEKYFQNRAIVDRPSFQQNYFYQTLRQMPGVGAVLEGLIEPELHKEAQSMMAKNAQNQLAHPRKELSREPLHKSELDERYAEWSKPFQEVKKNPDKVSGELYMQHPPEYYEGLKKLVYTLFYNPLHPDSKIAMTREIARYAGILREWFHGDAEYFSVVITPGGSYSLIEAFKTYVHFGRSVKGIVNPELIIPNTIHAAVVSKAEELTGVKVHLVPVDPVTGRADVQAMREKINGNTVALFASAPNFMNGAIDDIEALGELAYEHSIGLHVDSCLGGRITCHLPENFKIDFRVKGVTSISSDDHKYGGSPKGFSAVMFGALSIKRGLFGKVIAKTCYQVFGKTVNPDAPRDASYFMQHTLKNEQEEILYRLGESCMNLNKDWPGGLYASVGLTSSGSLLPLISGLYTIDFYGEKHFITIARDLITLREKLQTKFQSGHPLLEEGDLVVLGDPASTVLAFGSKTQNAHCIAERMRANGWDVSILQHPDSLHIAFTESHIHEKSVDRAVKEAEAALIKATKEVKLIPRDKQKPSAGASAYATIRSIPTVLGDPVVRKVVFSHFRTQQDLEYKRDGQVHVPERPEQRQAWTARQNK